MTYPGPSTTTYAFDAFGNRTSMTTSAGTTAYTSDDADRITEVQPPSPAPAIAYDWDDNGNLVERGSDTFEWDYEDRLVEATVNSVTTAFAYSGDGLRDSRTVGMTTTTFTWDINAGLPVVLDDGNQYLYGAGLAAMKQSGNWYYYLADGLGSTMAVVDSSGDVENGYTYEVYGEPTVTGSLANEFDFAGQQTDGSIGLQYLRARYYDPATGVFLSRDPMAQLPSWLGSPFGYTYADPIGLSDPTGLDSPWSGWKKRINPCSWGSLTGGACGKAGEVIDGIRGAGGPVVGPIVRPLVIIGDYLRLVGNGISDWMKGHPDEMNFLIGTAFTLGFGACLATAVVSAGGTSPGCVAIASGWGARSAATALDHLENSDGNRTEKSIRMAVDVINSLPMGKARTIMMNLLSTLVNPEAVR